VRVRVRVGVGLRGFVRVCVWVGGGVWVLSNQIKIKIKSNQNQNQSIKIKTSEVTVTSFCSHESTPALTSEPESTLIHQKDRKICEVLLSCPKALSYNKSGSHELIAHGSHSTFFYERWKPLGWRCAWAQCLRTRLVTRIAALGLDERNVLITNTIVPYKVYNSVPVVLYLKPFRTTGCTN